MFEVVTSSRLFRPLYGTVVNLEWLIRDFTVIEVSTVKLPISPPGADFFPLLKNRENLELFAKIVSKMMKIEK